MAIAAQGIFIFQLNQLSNGMLTVAYHLGRFAPRRCRKAVTNHEQTIVGARQVALNNSFATKGLSNFKASTDIRFCLNVGNYAFTLITIFWFKYYWSANFLGCSPRIIG